MQAGILILIGLMAAADAPPAVRFGIAPDLAAFPQKTPQDTLASVVKTIEAKRFDYLVAQLADPEFVDDRVKRLYGGQLAGLVEDARTRLDAPTLKLLRRFLKDGDWDVGKDNAVVKLKEGTDFVVHFRLANGRWTMEHRNKP